MSNNEEISMKSITTISMLSLMIFSLSSDPAIAEHKQAIVNVPPDSRLSCDDAICGTNFWLVYSLSALK
jgi:hypothetical protein